jgi:hypothetical protein
VKTRKPFEKKTGSNPKIHKSRNNKLKNNTMARQDLRDNRGSIIGTIETKSDGKQEIRDSRGSLKGTYDPKSNQTRDSRGSLVGTGNLLTRLL